MYPLYSNLFLSLSLSLSPSFFFSCFFFSFHIISFSFFSFLKTFPFNQGRHILHFLFLDVVSVYRLVMVLYHSALVLPLTVIMVILSRLWICRLVKRQWCMRCWLEGRHHHGEYWQDGNVRLVIECFNGKIDSGSYLLFLHNGKPETLTTHRSLTN